MKISEGIAQLQAAQNKLGDVDLKVFDEFGRLKDPFEVRPIEVAQGNPTAVRFGTK